MLSSDNKYLEPLIQTLSEGVAFYRAAADQAELPGHKAIFNRMAKARVFALSYLQPQVAIGDGEPESIHTFGSVLHKMYPDMLDGLSADHDCSLIPQVEQVENETLLAMRKTLSQVQSPVLQSILLDVYPRLNRSRDEVLRLDQAC